MELKYIITTLIFTVLMAGRSAAQTSDTTAVEQAGNIGYVRMMEEMAGSVTAPEHIEDAMSSYVEKNSTRRNLCYRVRIYFNNSRDARTVSSGIADEFRERFPSVPVYNQYANPYFKVTVGDFRTKSDAMKFLTQISHLYASAFLVREPVIISQSDR